MSKKQTKRAKNTKKSLFGAQRPAGHIIAALVIYIVGYALFLQALDSGSLLQWLGVLVAVALGTVRLIEGCYLWLKVIKGR